MPTYDYLCTKCGHAFEEIQKMSDPVLTKCPNCRGKLKRLIGAGAGIIFKGSGFYVTDSRKGSSTSTESKQDTAVPAKDTAKDTGKDSAKETGKESGKDSPKTESGKSAEKR